MNVAQLERTVCALVAYDGTTFNGFQVQEGVDTIQGTLETALAQVTGQFCRITGSGRTDTGVHARGQVVTAAVPWQHPLDALSRAWNHFLPPSVLVRCVTEAPDGFHPRFSATSRTYSYTVYCPVGSTRAPWTHFPTLDRYAVIEPYPLDLEAMNAASAVLVGEHDFATFGQPPQGEVTIRRVDEMMWQSFAQTPELAQIALQKMVFTVTANAFLRRMVRNLVGTLLAVGRSMWTVDDVVAALASCDRSKSAAPAPPQGLVLERVAYQLYPQLFIDCSPVA
ncbi:MAG: tRNA pseudouridine(38-40) synthase TruA [Caldilineaceae bacterium]